MQKINLPINGININQQTTLQKTTRLINSVGCFLIQPNKGENFMITRKIFLALVIAAMTTITVFAQADENRTQEGEIFVKNNNTVTPTGSWIGVVTNTQGGPPPFRVLMNFTADGGFTGSGDGDNSVGSPQYGVWERVGGRNSQRFAATFLQLFYAPDGSSLGSAKIRQTVILNSSGNVWQGPFKIDIFAPDGTVVFSGAGTAAATRIQSEPLP